MSAIRCLPYQASYQIEAQQGNSFQIAFTIPDQDTNNDIQYDYTDAEVTSYVARQNGELLYDLAPVVTIVDGDLIVTYNVNYTVTREWERGIHRWKLDVLFTDGTKLTMMTGDFIVWD